MRVSAFSAAAAAIATSILLANGAVAATVVGAKSIHITTAGPTYYIQISEVVALDFGNADVALDTNGGSAFAPNNYGGSGGPGTAIDGIYSAYPLEYVSVGTAGDYLDITFANATTLAGLSIYGRPDCCSDRDIYNFDIRDQDGQSLYSGILDADNTGHVGSVAFDRPVGGGVPEPATWALMIGGFGLAGGALRRRRAALSCA
ncbi:PEPxxWA-CTERM sorting domain-containing protein [Phenylobacterium sp.]|uniref:PEPxxWA-CTERM sorting domain-containing protein n=1 Tax=Phenylobacterium sp. TaxID=1871053 RepID=UPI00374DCFDC